MSWITWIVLGGVAGWIGGISAEYMTWRGIFWNIIAGITGSLAGSWILGSPGETQQIAFSIMPALVAVGSAIMLMFMYNLIRGRIRAY